MHMKLISSFSGAGTGATVDTEVARRERRSRAID
jgi:hypothetical protein